MHCFNLSLRFATLHIRALAIAVSLAETYRRPYQFVVATGIPGAICDGGGCGCSSGQDTLDA